MELDKYGLTKDKILEGDYAELTVVDNPKKVKEPMYLQSVVDVVIKDAFSDLEDVYRDNDDLTADNETLKAELEALQYKLQDATQNATVKSGDDAKLKQAENMLADLELSINNIKAKSAEDANIISNLRNELDQTRIELDEAKANPELITLRQRVQELEELDAQREKDYQILADDVNAVLDGLEAKFKELEG